MMEAAGTLKPESIHPFFLGKVNRLLIVTASSTKISSASSHKFLPAPAIEANPSSRIVAVEPGKQNAQPTAGSSKLDKDWRSSIPEVRLPSSRPRNSSCQEAKWPSRDMVHCRGLSEEIEQNNEEGRPNIRGASHPFRPRSEKQKIPATFVSTEENFLLPYEDLSRAGTRGNARQGEMIDSFKRPERRLMTGPQLQESIRSQLSCNLPNSSIRTAGSPYHNNITNLQHDLDNNQHEKLDILGSLNTLDTIGSSDTFDESNGCFRGSSKSSTKSTRKTRRTSHPALLRIFQDIAESLTAFDTLTYEKQDWMRKYAPRCASEVLQLGEEVKILRDWLKSLTVSTVETKATIAPQAEKYPKLKKRKRRRAEGLDDFIVSSEEEADSSELIELNNEAQVNAPFPPPKQSMVRVSTTAKPGDAARVYNSVVISGPHGCGKTAAVYAVSQELGFEVFEMNSGSRRSGKDLLDNIGDMTKNHLVHQAQTRDLGAEERPSISAKKGNVAQFFAKSRAAEVNDFRETKAKVSSLLGKQALHSEDSPTAPTRQQQSLILLEEVDVLFQEDKQFWTTALTLMAESKRPFIMTCTDESQLPLEDMKLFAIFRFQPPPDDIAEDLLLLMAANEGHILTRRDVATLYEAHRSDLRASIAELNFWCQMAVGDRKGGLEWMLLRSNYEECHNERGESLRVVSVGTFDGGRKATPATLDAHSTSTCNSLDSECFGVLEAESTRTRMTAVDGSRLLQSLRAFDLGSDALSAADSFPGLGLRYDHTAIIEATGSPLDGKQRVNYIEGAPVLQAELLMDFTNISQDIPRALAILSHQIIFPESLKLAFSQDISNAQQKSALLRSTQSAVKEATRIALDTLSESISHPKITSHFASSMPSIALDVTPFMRSIVRFDMKLEARRLQLSNLLSQGGRKGKKPRTTRASRAALEGGSKANTRRERWFPRRTNFAMVQRTGGSGWQDLVQSQDGQRSQEESRRSSCASGSSCS